MLFFYRCLHSLVREGRDIPRETLSSRAAASNHRWSVKKRVNNMLSIALVGIHLISASVSAVRRVLTSPRMLELLLFMMLEDLELFVSEWLSFLIRHCSSLLYGLIQGLSIQRMLLAVEIGLKLALILHGNLGLLVLKEWRVQLVKGFIFL